MGLELIMAFNISAPQTKFDIDGYGLAKAQLLMSQFNPYQGITDWLEKQGQEIADRNAIDAQDYLDNMNLDEITRLKAQGKDILKEYAKGKYFFDRTNEKVRQSAKNRSKEESDYVLGRYRKALADAMNSDSLQDGNYRQLLNNLGMAGRTAEEMEQYNDSYQDAWLKRYLEDLQTGAAERQMKDPTGGDTAQYVQDQLAKAGITKKSVSDLTGENLLPAMQNLSNSRLRELALNNANVNLNAEGLRTYQNELDKLSVYGTPDEIARAQMIHTRKANSIVSDTVRQVWNELQARAKEDPEILAELNNMDTVDIYQQKIIPAVAQLTGFSPEEIVRATTANRQDMYNYNKERSDYYNDIAEQESALTFRNWQSKDANNGIFNMLFTNSELSEEAKKLTDIDLKIFNSNLNSAGVKGIINEIKGLHRGMSDENATKLLLQILGSNGDMKKFINKSNGETLEELKKKVSNISEGIKYYTIAMRYKKDADARKFNLASGKFSFFGGY